MKIKALYFNGFALQNEQLLWTNLEPLELQRSHDVIGFNTGAIQAIKYALNSQSKIRRLSLISPIVWDNPEYQSYLFAQDPKSYTTAFFQKTLQYNHDAPSQAILDKIKTFYHSNRTQESYANLQKSLYSFPLYHLQILRNKNIEIEIYLGEYDQITSSQNTLNALKPYTNRIFLIKRQGHFLGMLERF